MSTPVTVEQLANAGLDSKTLADVAMSDGFTGASTENRDGVSIDTVEGRLAKMGYEVPEAYAGGISFGTGDRVKTVIESGVIYAPLATSLPFVTDGNFANDADKFFVIQSGTQINTQSANDILSVDYTNLIPTSIFVSGFSAGGDGGDGVWKSTGNTVAVSQTPAQLGSNKLSDSAGNEFVLAGEINVAALGGSSGDITTFYNAAVGALNGGYQASIVLPSGNLTLQADSTSLIDNKNCHIRGQGRGITRLITTTTGTVIDYQRTVGDSTTLTISDITIIADTITTAVAIQGFDSRVGVNGGIDCVVLHDVELEAENGGYWQKYIRMVETGGLVITKGYFRNDNLTTAQNDPLTAGIEIYTKVPGVSVIRAIDATQIYLQRCNSMILVDTDNTVESIYINSGEIVGCDYGVNTIGTGTVAAHNYNCHMDSIKRNFKFDTEVSSLIFRGDFRLQSNGAPADNSAVCMEFNGLCSGMNSTASLLGLATSTAARGYSFNGDAKVIDISGFMRGLNTGIWANSGNAIEHASADVNFGPNVNLPYVGPDNFVLSNFSSINADFFGDLNDLFTSASGVIDRTHAVKVQAGATNVPSGETDAGSICETLNFNFEAGYQFYYPHTLLTTYYYFRRRRAGIIGSWQKIYTDARFVDGVVEVGDKDSTSSAVLINFYSDPTASTSDGKIQVFGGSAVENEGTLRIDALNVTVTNTLRPVTDNTSSLGTAGQKWTEVFAVNGSINTSDEREKTEFRSISDSERLVAQEIRSLIGAFKWNDAVADKGDDSRIHFGVPAQKVKLAFERQGLDGFKYGLLCYDEWPEMNEVTDSDGNIIQEHVPAGNRYGIRYEELIMFIMASEN